MIKISTPSDPAYHQIREILSKARTQAWQAVNSAMVVAYWNIDRVIVEQEQKGESRAKYGEALIEELSHKLAMEFGKGFDRSNLWNMRAFYMAYPKFEALRRELSWTHYRLLLKVDKPETRSFYETECVNARTRHSKKKKKSPKKVFFSINNSSTPVSQIP